MKVRLSKAGRRRAADSPNSRSKNQRDNLLVIKLLLSHGKREKTGAQLSSRQSNMSDNRKPLVATCWPLISLTSFGMSTDAGHSSRHWWQLKQRSAISLLRSEASVFGSSSPVSTPRNRFAFALGEASSLGRARNTGHCRCSGAVVRQRPHPLHCRVARSMLSSSLQTCSTDKRRLASDSSSSGAGSVLTCVGFSSLTSSIRASTGRRFSLLSCRLAPVILPGLKRLLGSNNRLISGIARHSSPYCRGNNHDRLSPDACSLDNVPPCRHVASLIRSDRERKRCWSCGSAKSRNGRMCS